MQVQVIRYMWTGDDEIETGDYQDKTSHRMVVGKYLQLHSCGPWVPRKGTTRSCSGLLSKVEYLTGQCKRGPLGPQRRARNKASSCLSMYNYVHMVAKTRYYVQCTQVTIAQETLMYIYKYVHMDKGWTVTSRTIFGGASQFYNIYRLNVEQIVPHYDSLPGPPHLSSPPEAHN